ncbi:hypothetical protein LWI29_025748 [Acer saccharum]|uniref:Ubiquitin-like protease family profile domain-containing protein n=1 Tax=Acer saccharum TaxID=4024 RepID=A0AA39RJ49_ACESA|nr:hypothetical protein LWI29_025748 [Acer saccharum]
MGEKVELLVKAAEHFPAKINSTSSVAAVKCIKEKLTEAQLSLFRTTCFGKLLEMNDLKFSGQLVHNLLLRQIQSPVKSEMWFAVGGNRLRFSIQEFCLITGLECGPEPPVLSKEKGDGCGSFRSSMLNGEVRFNNKTLEAMFRAASSDNDEDMVKLALLYFLETVLFGKDQKVHIGAHHVELLEDLETFNKYPWGQKCYETTLNSLKRDLRRMSQEYHTTSREIVSGKKRKRQASKEKECIKQYPLHGFPYAFQIWACEAIPAVGVAIAVKSGCLLPRIVNWITPVTPDATYVMKLLDQKNTQVLQKLQPTPRESGEEYVKFLLSPECALEPPEIDGEGQEDMLASNESENVARERAEEKRPINVSTCHQQQSKHVCLDCKANNEENKRKLDTLGQRMDAMDKKLDFIITLLGGEGQTPKKDADYCREKMENEMEVVRKKKENDMEVDGKNMENDMEVEDKNLDKKVVLDIPEEEFHVDVWMGEEKGVQEHFESQLHVDDLSNDEGNTPTERVEDKCNTTLEITSPNTSQERSIIVYEQHPPIPPKRRSRKAAVLKSPYAETEVKKPKKLIKFKPFPKLPQSELTKFMSWLEEDDSVDFSKNVVQLPLCRATRAWFKTLYTPDKWLNDEQNLDARFGRYKNKEDLWQPRDRLFDYANGLSPQFATPWVETDKVYIPLNYESKHWILAEVDFIARKIIVYDSEQNFIGSGKKFNKFMEPLSTLLPLLLHAIEFFSKRPEIHHREDMTPWLVERCENVPQQEKSDCGVFVIKFAEHLIHGIDIDMVKAEKAQYFRQQLCLNLWRSRKAV